MIWNAIIKTNDTDLLNMWKEQVRKESDSNGYHYTIITEYLNGILNDLENYGIGVVIV